MIYSSLKDCRKLLLLRSKTIIDVDNHIIKHKWRSCNIQDRKILINLELAKKNPRGLEYILVHEMAHLLERNHNDRFKKLMDDFLPDWRAIKNEINGIV